MDGKEKPSAKKAFKTLKKELGDVTLMAIDEDRKFVVETDASNVAISATLNQKGEPVVFFSRTLNKPQKKYPIVDNFRKSKIKNLKIRNRKLELSGYRFDIEYKPDRFNVAADALTRNFNAKKNHGYVNSLITQDNLLEKLHKGLGCPGITRLFHQVKIRNLP